MAAIAGYAHQPLWLDGAVVHECLPYPENALTLMRRPECVMAMFGAGSMVGAFVQEAVW
jgi:hypothetical protein